MGDYCYSAVGLRNVTGGYIYLTGKLQGVMGDLQGCQSSDLGFLQRFYRVVIKVLQGCYTGVTAELQRCYTGVTQLNNRVPTPE